MCLVTGAISGNLEMIDFDCAAEFFGPWLDLVRGEAPDLVSRLVVERSMSGGRHVIYRSESRVSENVKLAQRIVPTPDDRPIVLYGKTHKPRKVDGRWAVTLTFIETRGEGGIFLCAATPGYELEHGSFTELPVVSDAERELMLQAAWSLTEVVPDVEPIRVPGEPCGRPGDDYNEHGDVREVLKKHGWALVRPWRERILAATR